MHATLFCPGPSLTAVPDPAIAGEAGQHSQGFTIGVNRAALWRRCDVWACGDYPLIEKYRGQVLDRPSPAGWPRVGLPPALLTARNSATWLREHHAEWHGRTIEFEECYHYCDPGLRWDLFSSTAALIYAARLGASRIDVYGTDWAGTQDADGVEAGGNRTPERWRLERELWVNIVTPWLSHRGVEVIRHCPLSPDP